MNEQTQPLAERLQTGPGFSNVGPQIFGTGERQRFPFNRDYSSLRTEPAGSDRLLLFVPEVCRRIRRRCAWVDRRSMSQAESSAQPLSLGLPVPSATVLQ